MSFISKRIDHQPQLTENISGIKTYLSDKIRIKPITKRKIHHCLKRTFDIFISCITVVLLIPVYLIIALIIRLDSPGFICYKSPRYGKNKKIFEMYKFRTMIPNADDSLNNNSELITQYMNHIKLKNDPRITRVGKFLRKSSLDELPQFLNVLKGDMSLVGPRPKLLFELDKYSKNGSHKVFNTAPGLTGLWQISGRSTLSYEERMRLDLLYVENQSMMMDIKIMLKTIPAIFRIDEVH